MTMPRMNGAYVYKNASITVNGTQYANAVIRGRLVPTQEIQTVKVLVPDGVLQDVDDATYVFSLLAVSASVTGDSGSLWDVIDSNSGLELDVVLTPKAGEGKEATFTVLGMRLPFGGEENGQFATFEIDLPVVVAPVYSDVT
jgi:hypothetical protein